MPSTLVLARSHCNLSHPDGRRFIIHNAVLAKSTVQNLSASQNTALIFKPTISAATPEPKVQALKQAVQAFINRRPDVYQSEFKFLNIGVDGTKNALNLEIRVYFRGYTWDMYDNLSLSISHFSQG